MILVAIAIKGIMENSGEPSSSISFTSSSHLSNGSINYNIPTFSGRESGSNIEIISLCKLSSNLELLLTDPSYDYSDAYIVVEGIAVGIHRCVLAPRSKFFHELFQKGKGKDSVEKLDGKPKYCMNDLLPYGRVGYEAFLIFLGYLYTGKVKSSPPEVSTCVDKICAHDACRPAIDFAVELMYASSIFQVPELVSLFQRRLLNFVGKAPVEDVIPILLVAFHCESSQLLTQCINRVARSDLDKVSLERELPIEIAENIKTIRVKSHDDDTEMIVPEEDPLREKRIRRIHKALDSDDVELVKLLLTESNITLDEAYALHYAVAYCDPKIVSEVLSLGLADVNLMNARGYTVLHVAAMRGEPSIIVSLLAKGACAFSLTLDGQSAGSICRRMTRLKDYNANMKQGRETNKNRLCIDVLEREIMRNPMAVAEDSSNDCPVMADDLHMKLLYLENRVAFARLFFPTEAKVAMDIANAETTFEFAGLLPSKSKRSSANLREVDLNESPIMQKKRLHTRMEALSKTVETGKRFFPHCSQVLDKFMEDDLPDLLYLEKGSAEEQKIKRTRFVELKDDVQKAFNKDRAEQHRCGISSSSSSSSPKIGPNSKIKKNAA